MAFSKEDLYGPEELRVSMYIRALAHSARRRILKQLRRDGILCVYQIEKEHPICQETLSQHLSILREAGLVDYEEVAPYTYYWIIEENLDKAKQCCFGFFKDLDRIGKESKRRTTSEGTKTKRNMNI